MVNVGKYTSPMDASWVTVFLSVLECVFLVGTASAHPHESTLGHPVGLSNVGEDDSGSLIVSQETMGVQGS